MADNQQEVKCHVSIKDRLAWNKVVADFNVHLGAGGVANHALGNGTIPGFSTNDFTNQLLEKLNGIQAGALNNPHPETHPYDMITGLHRIASSGDYRHLKNIPKTFFAGGGNSDTVGGIRITINSAAPPNPQENKEIWINTDQRIIYIYLGGKWQGLHCIWI